MKVSIRSLVLAVVAGMSGSVLAAEAWVAVPSTPTADQRMVINGGGLSPSAVVNLRITHPSGAVSVHSVVADAAGKLRFDFALPATGGYSVEAHDASGKLIGGGRLGHFR